MTPEFTISLKIRLLKKIAKNDHFMLDMTIKKHETQKSSIVVAWNPPSVLIQFILFNRTDERDFRRENKVNQYILPSTSKSITLPFILPGRRYKLSLQVCYR